MINGLRGRPATRRRQVMTYVGSEISEHGRAPSYQMIGAAFGMGRPQVARIVAKLEDQGLLKRAGRGRVRRISLA